jgi:hypothetical protein
MNQQVVGTYHLLDKRPEKVKASMKVAYRIGDVVARQVELRGEDKPFTFKAFGFRWQYVPEVKRA